MTVQNSSLNPSYVLMTRRTIMRAVIVAIVVGGGVTTASVLQRVFNQTFEKPPMPLSKALPELSREIGNYKTFGPDGNMDAETVDVLGTKDYLVRTYSDSLKKPGEVGEKFYLNLNYYSTGEATPHVPERCWAGNGLVEKPGSRHPFVVSKVRHKDGSTFDLRMTMVSFLPSVSPDTPDFVDKVDDARLLNVAYCFQVNGQYVATPKEVMSTFWKAENKYAYHTKIEVALKGQYCKPEEAEVIIGDYMRAALPEIEECLPDPRRLK